MTPDKHELDRLFQLYMDGQSTPAERRILWKWFFLLDLRSQELAANKELESAAGAYMHQHIFSQIHRQQKIRNHRWQYAAAAVIIGVILSIGFYLLRNISFQQQMATIIRNDSAAVITYYLPDSSKVLLSRSSQLSLDNNFNKTERRVVLKGEGYFDIHPDPVHPFVVESRGIETKALGTAFTIESYENETEVRVALLQGSVQVSDSSRFAILQPGQLLRYQQQHKDFKIEKISVSDPLAWTQGGLTFYRIPLTEALDRLARRYGLSIRYNASSLKGKLVSGSFNSMSWEKILPNILFTHDLKYSQHQGAIIIHK